MGRAVMKPSEVDFADVQGLVRFGYGKMKRRFLCALAGKGCGCRARVVAYGADHQRRDDESTATDRVARRLHGRRTARARMCPNR